MSIGVQSYPELYTMLLGWNLYDQIWDLLSQSGLAYLPFIGILLRNMAQPYTSQETKDAGSTSLRRMEVDFIGTLLFIFFGVSPAFLLNPSLVSYTPLCPVDGQNETVHPGNTGTTYDSAFSVPTEEIRVPIWWYAVVALSEGITSGANTIVSCVPDLRSMVTQADMARITDPQLKHEVAQFEQDCFIPARTQYLADTHTNADTISVINSNQSTYGSDDTEWAGSHGFDQTYYQNLKASQPVPGFAYDANQDINADTNEDNPPAYGTPTCDQWWNDPQNGLRLRLINLMSAKYWSDFAPELVSDKTKDDVLKQILFNNTGYDKANDTVGDIGYSHLAAGLGEWFQQLDTYPKLYAAAQAAPIIQALLLLMVYAFLPLALVFTGYKPGSFISGAVIIFSLIFWSFIWHLVSWTDTALMNALYGDSWFSHQSPNASLVDMITGTLIIIAPLFWFSFMGSMGVAVGNLVTVAFDGLMKPAEDSAMKGAKLIKDGGKFVWNKVNPFNEKKN
ncbi:MAG TPA: conjugal transfer protein TraG N-terminal domain-containing protein [Gammaproteobacteria bacterium]|nr:conjugal transfer protein TraG N-terminal domain-containing protein [Gammaproteobacteria bacterium]HVY54094.1 conjugal transfer protein TraG N-terminal domain-containing protein [Gammaproteobacteria bacterium]